jgi:hypothetical protein
MKLGKAEAVRPCVRPAESMIDDRGSIPTCSTLKLTAETTMEYSWIQCLPNSSARLSIT